MYLETAPILSVMEIKKKKKKLGNSIPLFTTILSHKVSIFFFKICYRKFKRHNIMLLIFLKKETEYSNHVKKRKMCIKNKWFELLQSVTGSKRSGHIAPTTN